MSLPVPVWLEQPIWSEPPPRLRAPTGYIDPRLVAEPQPPAEWAHAGYLDPRRSTGAMQMGAGVVEPGLLRLQPGRPLRPRRGDR